VTLEKLVGGLVLAAVAIVAPTAKVQSLGGRQGRSQGTHHSRREVATGRTPASFAPYQRALCNKCHVKD
jgi:hypothetical protein